MKRLNNPNLEPPSGWIFTDPDTEYMMVGSSLMNLISQAKDHRKANSLEIPENFAAIVEHAVCLANDPEFSTGELEAGQSHSSMMDEYQIRSHVMKLLISWKMNGSVLVEENIAIRRAEVCSGCSENVRSPICLGCVGLIDLTTSYFRRTMPLDDRLKVCRKTACMLKTQVHVPNEALIEFETDFPEPCWYGKALDQRS